jgi:2-iminobutanoate/2-iminopropanoate deaminase
MLWRVSRLNLRLHPRGITEIRTEIFGNDFPASGAITVTGFADPTMLIEIQGVAVSE